MRDMRTAEISIHAPLAGCDLNHGLQRPRGAYFNPRTPCGVRLAGTAGRWRLSKCVFQSTHPLRGATANAFSHLCFGKFQSTHPLRGATRHPTAQGGRQADFNPRTPCGVRHEHESNLCYGHYFNPRTPCGVRRLKPFPLKNCFIISIHAPLAGCDQSLRRLRLQARNFNPRTPCGVRRYQPIRRTHHRHFNPRTPCGVRRQSGNRA